MRTLALTLAVLCLCVPALAQDPVAAAQALYAAAQYEEALKAFEALKAAGEAPRQALAIEQGRAFCLLALDRKADAERAIETILDLDPFFKPAEDETPPKIRAAFRDVRRRALAGVVQRIYQRAKDAYERKAFDAALTGFGQTLKLLDDPDLVMDAGPRGDMRMVARGFEDLAKAASRPPAPAPSNAPTPENRAAGDGRTAANTDPSAAAGAPASPLGSASTPKSAASLPLYDATSKDVTPPIPQLTDVPIPSAVRRTLPKGEVVVEVIVSASGAVESATARQSPDPVLGQVVARAVREWRYRPAVRAGTPVRYRLMVRVVVSDAS